MNSIRSGYIDTESNQMTVHNQVKLCLVGTMHPQSNAGILHFKGSNYMIEHVESSHNPAQLAFKLKVTRDMALDDIRQLSGNDFPQDILVTSDCFEDEGYTHSGYYHFLHSDAEMQVCLECNYWFQEWNYPIDLLSFIAAFTKALGQYADIKIHKNILFEEGMVNIHIIQKFDCAQEIGLMISQLEHRLRNEHTKALDWRSFNYTLSINERWQASAKAVINNVSDIIAELNKVDNDIVVNITQQGLNLSLGFRLTIGKILFLKKILEAQSVLFADYADKIGEVANFDLTRDIKKINLLASYESNQRLLNLISSHYYLEKSDAVNLYQYLSERLLEIAESIQSELSPAQ